VGVEKLFPAKSAKTKVRQDVRKLIKAIHYLQNKSMKN
jgi:hypothetical protein